MGRAVFILLLVITAVVVALSIWSYQRDEYPFRIEEGAITGMRYVCWRGDDVVWGYIREPSPQLAGWISTMERDTSGEHYPTERRVIIDLVDGRRLQLDFGGNQASGGWLGSGDTLDRAVTVHADESLLNYLDGIDEGIRAGQAAAAVQQ